MIPLRKGITPEFTLSPQSRDAPTMGTLIGVMMSIPRTGKNGCSRIWHCVQLRRGSSTPSQDMYWINSSFRLYSGYGSVVQRSSTGGLCAINTNQKSYRPAGGKALVTALWDVSFCMFGVRICWLSQQWMFLFFGGFASLIRFLSTYIDDESSTYLRIPESHLREFDHEVLRPF